MSGQRRRAERPRLPVRSLLLVLGAAAALVGWWLLVRVAISLGHAAVAGAGGSGWAGTVAVGAGATLCLLAALLLLGRVRTDLTEGTTRGRHRR